MAAPPSTVAHAPSVLVVFDYDWSLVNENSDTFVFQQLHPALLDNLTERYRLLHPPSWTKLMDKLLLDLARQQPHVSAAVIKDTLARIPVLDKMLDAVRLAVETHGAVLKIVSDANTVYIDAMVAHHGLECHVSEIFTNPGFFDDADARRLRVQPYHALHLDPHGCTNCPANMCKGQILDKILSERRFSHVLYVGDGAGDFCPSTRLSPNDVVFARANDVDGKSYGLLKKLHANQDKVAAKVVPWSSGEDIYNHFDVFFRGLKAAQPQA